MTLTGRNFPFTYCVNISGHNGIHARDWINPASRYTASIDLPGYPDDDNSCGSGI